MPSGAYCAVDGCRSSKMRDKHLSFFHLPVSDERRKTWTEVIGRPDLARPEIKPKSHYVCCLHFEQSNIIYKPQLRPDALPTKLLPSLPTTPSDNTQTNTKEMSTQTEHSNIKPLKGKNTKKKCDQSKNSKNKWQSELVQTSHNSQTEQTQTSTELSSNTPRTRRPSQELKVSEIKRRKLDNDLDEIKQEVQSKESHLMEEGSSDENEADDEDKNEDEDIADDDDQIETLVIKEEPIEPYNEEPEAYVELPAVKQEPGEFGDNQEVAQPVSVRLKTEPQDEEEATTEEKRKELKRKKTNARQRAYYHRQKDLKINAGIIKKTVPKSNAERQRKFRQRNAEKSYMDISTETTAVQLASKSKKRRTTKRNTDVPPAATISPATSVLPGTSTPGSSAIPGTSAPPERRLILLEDGEVKMEQIEIGEEGFS